MKKSGDYLTMVQTDVALMSFMIMVDVFFTGILISQYNEYDPFIKIPVAFLIISTLSFLFSALVISNSSAEIISNRPRKFKRHFDFGYIVSEYLGIYPLVISIPMIVNVVTTDTFLRVISLIAALIGLAAYQFMHVSIVEKHFPKQYHIISAFTIVAAILLFVTQVYRFYFLEFAVLVMVYLIFVTYLAAKLDAHSLTKKI